MSDSSKSEASAQSSGISVSIPPESAATPPALSPAAPTAASSSSATAAAAGSASPVPSIGGPPNSARQSFRNAPGSPQTKRRSTVASGNAAIRSKANVSNELKIEMIDTFDMLDEEGSGFIDPSKIVLALKIFGFDVGADVHERANDPKPMDLAEFMTFLGTASNTQTGWCQAEAAETFTNLDRERIQSVSTAHLRRALGRFGEKFTDAEINDQISAFDVDSSESIEFTEFMNMILMMNNKR